MKHNHVPLGNNPVILPAYIERCPVCKGAGEYEQTYNIGCGRGHSRMMGPCDYCKPPYPTFLMASLGYRMKSGAPVPYSVINQMNIIIRRSRGEEI